MVTAAKLDELFDQGAEALRFVKNVEVATSQTETRGKQDSDKLRDVASNVRGILDQGGTTLEVTRRMEGKISDMEVRDQRDSERLLHLASVTSRTLDQSSSVLTITKRTEEIVTESSKQHSQRLTSIEAQLQELKAAVKSSCTDSIDTSENGSKAADAAVQCQFPRGNEGM
jgi:hypothetical protein